MTVSLVNGLILSQRLIQMIIITIKVSVSEVQNIQLYSFGRTFASQPLKWGTHSFIYKIRCGIIVITKNRLSEIVDSMCQSTTSSVLAQAYMGEELGRSYITWFIFKKKKRSFLLFNGPKLMGRSYGLPGSLSSPNIIFLTLLSSYTA